MDELIEGLLELHCQKCYGMKYGCRGCNQEQQIKEVLRKNERLKTLFAD